MEVAEARHASEDDGWGAKGPGLWGLIAWMSAPVLGAGMAEALVQEGPGATGKDPCYGEQMGTHTCRPDTQILQVPTFQVLEPLTPVVLSTPTPLQGLRGWGTLTPLRSIASER